MGVDKHHLALVLVIGIVLIGLFVLLSFGRENFAGEATFIGDGPITCGAENDDDPCLQVDSEVVFVCELLPDQKGICVPSNRTADTDKDGLKDYDEVVFYGTDYLLNDTDGDCLPGSGEVCLVDSREAVVWEAGQSVDDSSSLVITLTSSLRRLFGVE